jgi:hypothetical protein
VNKNNNRSTTHSTIQPLNRSTARQPPNNLRPGHFLFSAKSRKVPRKFDGDITDADQVGRSRSVRSRSFTCSSAIYSGLTWQATLLLYVSGSS